MSGSGCVLVWLSGCIFIGLRCMIVWSSAVSLSPASEIVEGEGGCDSADDKEESAVSILDKCGALGDIKNPNFLSKISGIY